MSKVLDPAVTHELLWDALLGKWQEYERRPVLKETVVTQGVVDEALRSSLKT